MVDDGDFEATFGLLLKCPDRVHGFDRTRVDWLLETLRCRESTQPCDAKTRTTFAQFLRYVIFRRLQRDAFAGVTRDTNEFFVHPRSVFEYAEQDETGVVPGHSEWYSILNDSNKVREVRSHDPDAFGPRPDLPGRRLLRSGNLGFSQCPSATLLALGPQVTGVGDEVCFTAGSLMPFALRKNATAACPAPATMKQAGFVGEVFVNGADQLADKLKW